MLLAAVAGVAAAAVAAVMQVVVNGPAPSAALQAALVLLVPTSAAALYCHDCVDDQAWVVAVRVAVATCLIDALAAAAVAVAHPPWHCPSRSP